MRRRPLRGVASLRPPPIALLPTASLLEVSPYSQWPDWRERGSAAVENAAAQLMGRGSLTVDFYGSGTTSPRKPACAQRGREGRRRPPSQLTPHEGGSAGGGTGGGVPIVLSRVQADLSGSCRRRLSTSVPGGGSSQGTRSRMMAHVTLSPSRATALGSQSCRMPPGRARRSVCRACRG